MNDTKIGPIDIKNYDNDTASVYTAAGHLVAELDFSNSAVKVLSVIEMNPIGTVRKGAFDEWDASMYVDDHVQLLGSSHSLEAAVIKILNRGRS